jgi:hypothetical protein
MRLLLLAGAAAVLAAGAATSATRAPTWRALHRPLHVPRIAPGAPCPTSKADPRGDLSRFGGFVGLAWGRGPAYPVLNFDRERPLLLFRASSGPNDAWPGSEWRGQKVMWIVAPRSGRVLVRGRQLDGPNELRFNGGIVPARELRLRGSLSNPSYTRLKATGCYGYQIDGARFSRVIVFEARTFPNG